MLFDKINSILVGKIFFLFKSATLNIDNIKLRFKINEYIEAFLKQTEYKIEEYYENFKNEAE